VRTSWSVAAAMALFATSTGCIFLTLACLNSVSSFSIRSTISSKRPVVEGSVRQLSLSSAAVDDSVEIVSEMPPPLPTNLNNSYYLLRHGQSTANVAQIISSARSLAHSDQHGLTELGAEQATNSAAQLVDLLRSSKREKVVFLSSPFARARQTAQACLVELQRLRTTHENNNNFHSNNNTLASLSSMQVVSDVVIVDDLMERYFGRLDGQAIYTYAYVWPLDQFNVTHVAFDVESVAAVCHRLRRLLLQTDSTYNNCAIVFTSHADVLQIAQLYAASVSNVGAFSSFRFQNGEVRELIVGSAEHLPRPVPLEAPCRGTSQYVETKRQRDELWNGAK
jgi:broad specificity phosphatase PhoE